MKVIMKAQGVWCAIEQKDPKGGVDEKMVQVALPAIYQGVPEDVLMSISEKETAKEAWEAIKMMCMGVERVKEAKVQTLKVPDKFLQITSNIEQFGEVKGMTVEEVVGRLKAHEERMKGRSESVDGQLLLTSRNQRPRGGSFRDKSRIKCYNCNTTGHYAAECDKPATGKRERQEVNLAQIEDDEPALL
ncbi:uncharacterized protein LOC141701222 [Apium graveolens]|uniref:uncharacterized protein LOC141701222 n=1 Tax=Apium graveolens TaxID=4045 RepID=UPI003D79AA6E